MASKNNNMECMITCWGIAAFVGFLAMVLLYWMADFGALQAIFTGGLIGTVLGLVLSLTVCRTQTAAADLASEDKPATRYAAEAAERKAARVASTLGTAAAAPASAAAAAAAPAASTTTASTDSANTTPSTAFSVQPSKPLPGQEELASRKGEWKYEGDAAVEGNAAPAAKAAPAKKASAPAKGADPAPAAKAAPAKKASAKAKAADPAPAAAGGDDAPALMLSAARPEGKDDLKLISGVGPKLEGTLNDLGIYHFDQVAKFQKADIEWVDARLRFKGRIERDDWMSQAKILAEGGETEFSKKKKT
ncbi:endonuclease [uncultured Sulfitobacter sp.]|uniref:endonuclease n=1 Tax=uncultured Sulfitobacter sp. TaxID=191468 RepID=UPI0026277989|nr:endonuclease [uncultured Sulfitobacter sp.]